MSQRNINPYSGGSNLGFNARTTTGGTYENPRLGIEDTTAFGRGVTSTFRLPKKEEKNILNIPDLIIDSKSGNEWFEKNGNVNDLHQNFGTILNNQWKNDMTPGGAGYYQNMNKNSKKGSPEYNYSLQAVGLFKEAFGPEGNFAGYVNVIGDGEKVDLKASNAYLPGLDGVNSSFTFADITADSQNNPQNWKMSSKVDKLGQLKAGLIHVPTGEFIDITAMDAAWRDSNVAEYFDYESSILEKHDVVKNINFNKLDVVNGVILGEGGKEFNVKETSRYYDKADFFNFEGQVGSHTTQQVKFMESNGLLKSAYRQVSDLMTSGEFNLSADLLNQINLINQEYSELGDNVPDRKLANKVKTWKKAVVADYYNEQFKLRNGSDYYARDDRFLLTDSDGNYNMGDNSKFVAEMKDNAPTGNIIVNENFDVKKPDTTPYNPNFSRSIARTSDNIDFFERDISNVELRKQKSNTVRVNVGGGDSSDDVSGVIGDAFTIIDEELLDLRYTQITEDFERFREGPLQEGAGAKLLDLNNSDTIENLQRSIQGLRGVSATLQTRNDLKRIIGKNIIATNDAFEGIANVDQLEGDLKATYDLLVEKKFNDQMSADPDAELIFYDQSNNKVIAAGRLDNKMYYGEDVVQFIKQFAKSESQKKELQKIYRESDRYDIDQLLKKAVESGSNEGLSPEQIKTANWIRSKVGKNPNDIAK